MKATFLLLLYFLTRLANLLILPIFTDESSYIYTAQLMKADLSKYWDLSLNLPTVKPPLFFLLTIISEIFNSNSLLTGRIVSVIAGGFTCLGLFLLTKKFFNQRAALIASLLYITSPFSLTYDRLALMDSLMATFSVWIFFIAIKYIEKKKIIYLSLLIIFCFLALLTKQSGKFFLLMLPFIPIILKGKNGFKTALVLIFTSILTYSIYFLLLTRSQYFDFYNNFDRTYINFSPEIIVNNSRAIFSWIKSYFPLIFISIPFSIFYVLLRGLRKGLVLTFWAFVPLAISVSVGQYFFPRYLLPSIVLLFPLLAFLFKKYLLLLPVMLIPSIIFDYYILTDPPRAPYHYNERDQFISGWPAGYGVREAFIKLNSLDKKAKILVEGDNGHFYSSFKLLDPKFRFYSFKQNLSVEEILKIAKENNSDYLLTNRENAIIDQDFLPMWNYQKPNGGVYINLYEAR